VNTNRGFGYLKCKGKENSKAYRPIYQRLIDVGSQGTEFENIIGPWSGGVGWGWGGVGCDWVRVGPMSPIVRKAVLHGVPINSF